MRFCAGEFGRRTLVEISKMKCARHCRGRGRLCHGGEKFIAIIEMGMLG